VYRVGDLVVTPDGVGEVEAIMRQQDRHGLWIWGQLRWPAGPYLVRLTRGALAAYDDCDLCYHRAAPADEAEDIAWP
jgi:hypothetical protein